MIILAIDTSGPAASCAVMKDGRILHSISMVHGLTHSQTVMPAVDAVLEASGLTCADVDVFAAVAGPGSFTGVRIGICTAKGLAHAAGKKCVSLDALEVLAMNFPYGNALVCPILDARRDQVYCALFDTSNGMPKRIYEDEAISLTALLEKLPKEKKILFCGDGLEKYRERIEATLGSRAVFAFANGRDLRAEAACVLAENNAEGFIEPHALKPLYLRLPQAERERNAKQSGGAL